MLEMANSLLLILHVKSNLIDCIFDLNSVSRDQRICTDFM